MSSKRRVRCDAPVPSGARSLAYLLTAISVDVSAIEISTSDHSLLCVAVRARE